MPSLQTLTSTLGKLGTLHRIGGPERVYTVASEHQKAVLYAINDSLMAIALGWTSSPSTIETIFFWKEFSFARAPDYAIDIPEGDVAIMAPKIMQMIKVQTMGEVAL